MVFGVTTSLLLFVASRLDLAQNAKRTRFLHFRIRPGTIPESHRRPLSLLATHLIFSFSDSVSSSTPRCFLERKLKQISSQSKINKQATDRPPGKPIFRRRPSPGRRKPRAPASKTCGCMRSPQNWKRMRSPQIAGRPTTGAPQEQLSTYTYASANSALNNASCSLRSNASRLQCAWKGLDD